VGGWGWGRQVESGFALGWASCYFWPFFRGVCFQRVGAEGETWGGGGGGGLRDHPFWLFLGGGGGFLGVVGFLWGGGGGFNLVSPLRG